jgi:benzoyl-CoA reductase/2-hydroxyglutaryl-CoA dehydratase subunit BcrC/BadD/HgdB
MDKSRYNAKMKELMEELKKLPAENFDGIKVVVTGILVETDALLDAFVENKMVFVADDLAHESRQFRTCARSEGTALERLAYRIADHDGCSLLYDEEKKHGQLLIELVRDNRADGVVVCMMKFCNPEEFDYPIYKKELEAAGIPMLYLEIEQKMDSAEQIRNRIQSFAEMIK